MAHPTLSYMSLFPCIPPSVFCRGTRISFQNHWALVGCVFRLVSGFVTTLQAMHANKMYKKLVFYMEACNSGSMFEGLLDKGLRVLIQGPPGTGKVEHPKAV